MPTPTKKRKRAAGDGPAPRSLEYFFARQRQAVAERTERETTDQATDPATTDPATDSKLADTGADADAAPVDDDVPFPKDDPPDNPAVDAQLLADEALARKLQAAWDAEAVPGDVPVADTTVGGTSADDMPVTDALPLDANPLAFAPAQYVAALRREWGGAAARAPYALLVRCFVVVGATRGRTRIVDALTNGLRVLVEADAGSLRAALWLAGGGTEKNGTGLGPAWAGGPELGLGGSAVARAVRAASGRGGAAVAALFARHGDAGDVAHAVWQRRQRTLVRVPPLTIVGVYETLQQIAACQGTGSGEAKQRLVARLLQGARSGEESRFLVRTLAGALRIGAVQTTLLVALARAFVLSQKGGATKTWAALGRAPLAERAARYARAEAAVRASFARRPTYDDLVEALLDGTWDDDAAWDALPVRCGFVLHVPLRPMLGLPTRDLAAVLARLQGGGGAFACEAKYDGQRAQVHWERGPSGRPDRVSLFSRHLERITDQYPDVVAVLPQVAGSGVASFVLEGEIVAVDRATGALRPFQVLAGRAGRGGPSAVDVCLFVFDLLFLDGQPLLDRPLRERRQRLRTRLAPVAGRVAWVASTDVSAAEAAEADDAADGLAAFFASATALGCEGVMVKALDAAYAPDRRAAAWCKVKKDYAATADTLDLVPVAGWRGMGRKAAWWSPVLLAVRDEASGALEAVAKCMSGFSDAFYRASRAHYDPAVPGRTLARQPAWVVYDGPAPDVWFAPQAVWETAFADITVSPTYAAARGLVHAERGLSLRFPRFVRARDDKGVAEASTSGELAALYRQQASRDETEMVIETGTLTENDK